MVILLSIYALMLLSVIAYAIINIFHLLKFKLPYKGDLSFVLLGVYLVILMAIIGASVIFGIFSYYNL